MSGTRLGPGAEFDRIRAILHELDTRAAGVGDDAALLPHASGQLLVSTDLSVEDVHFRRAWLSAEEIGWRAAAASISDLAAMGARPRYALLALTLPEADEEWVGEFADGFLRLADSFEVELIGGDTTRGPLAITVTALGEVLPGKALTRAGARVGDQVWVSGVLGSASLALLHLQGALRLRGPDLAHCLARLHTPTPRVALGAALVGIASAAIDVSDGLVADLGHICERSGTGAEIDLAAVPCVAEVTMLRDVPLVRDALLAGGDDYELVFTAPVSADREIVALSGRLAVAATPIGRIVADAGVRVRAASGGNVELARKGFDHFN